MAVCFHCGDHCDASAIHHEEKLFCCHGCKTVFDIFLNNDLTAYYDLQTSPGAVPRETHGKYDFLNNANIAKKLLEFDDAGKQIATLYIPHIHCSSCIWILENIHKLQAEILAAQVNFPKKTVQITYNSDTFSLKKLVTLLSSIGYEPYISLEDDTTEKKHSDRSILYKLGISGFAFGNVMFLSFPEYFEVNEFWLDQYKNTFRWLMFSFSLPVVFYSAKDYFISAFRSIRSGILNIDIPIALGIFVLFLRSTTEIVLDWGSGFFDSLTGLVFFLLVGRFFQQKTYAFLSFERDYKSYFPIAVTRIGPDKKEESIHSYDIKKGDRLLIRNEELLPTDAILIKGNTHIDYSFVTGESKPVYKTSSEMIFAGGRQLSGAIEIEAVTEVKQSYLVQLWNNDVFKKDKTGRFQTLTDRISKRFTATVLAIAFIAGGFWLFYQMDKALSVFTAVLIIACPCAIALAAPFTMGNLLRIFGTKKLFLKNTSVIERLAQIDTVVFDKTGTLTKVGEATIRYSGNPLTKKEKTLLKSALRTSNHPLSRSLYEKLKQSDTIALDACEELPGKGITAFHKNTRIKIGTSDHAERPTKTNILETAVHIRIGDYYKGFYVFRNSYREGVTALFKAFDKKEIDRTVLSGDNAGERSELEKLLPKNTTLLFDQKPEEKLQYIKSLQKQGKKVMMLGDGLNDAGALAQSDVGIAIAENINVFSPACDGILDAERFKKINSYMNMSKKGIRLVKCCFVFSLCYNLIGLYFAVTGQLSPVIAAILMPLSSISIVVFATVATNILGKQQANR